MTIGVDATEPSTRVKGEQTLDLQPHKERGPSVDQRGGLTQATTRVTTQSMAADSRESGGIVLVIVGQF